MSVDYNVNLAEVASLVLAGASVVVSHIVTTRILGFRMKAVESQLGLHSRELSTLANIIGNQRVMEERMLTLRRDLDDLRRGKGFIREEFPKVS